MYKITQITVITQQLYIPNCIEGTRTKDPKQCHEKTPQTMIEAPCLCTIPTWYAGFMASLALRHILSLPSALSSRNRNSSLYVTRFQSSTLQSMCSLVQAKRAVRWQALSNGTLVGRLLPKPIRQCFLKFPCSRPHVQS
ncbi:hypothetical protein TNCV_614661 [Trichonephila clavipes]|nr:hypothetical protein TNCV_614661 [Trichonephila clavipes]